MKRKIVNNSPVIVGIVSISCLALLLNNLTNGATNVLIFSTYRSSLADPLTYVRAICHIFGHANMEHLTSNMVIILLIGPLLEEKYGSTFMVYITLITAICCSLANYILAPNTMLLGASGIAFTYIVLSSFTGAKQNNIPITFIIVIIVFVGSEVVQGFIATDNVSHFSHIIGGLLGGFIGNGINKPNSKIQKNFGKFDRTVDSFEKKSPYENGDNFTNRYYNETKNNDK